MPYDSLLRLRPTNVMHQLPAESKLPILNGRYVLDGLNELAHVLWMPAVQSRGAAAALLRAAAHLKAVVGISLAPSSADSLDLKKIYHPGEFFHRVIEEASQIERITPFLLHVDEPVVNADDGVGLDMVRDHIIGCLDAGFTSFGIDLSLCPSSECPTVTTKLLGPVFDLELCVVVRFDAPASELTARARQIALSMAALRNDGMTPDLVILPGPDDWGEPAWKLAKELAPLIAPSALGWKQKSLRVPGQLTHLSDVPIRALVGGKDLEPRHPEAGDSSDDSKTEAFAYIEATEMIEQLGGQGAALNLARLW